MYKYNRITSFLTILFIIAGINQLSFAQSIELVKDIKPGYKNSYPHKFTIVDEELYFVADHLGYPDLYGIWKTNGFEAGTHLVKDLDNPEISSNYLEFTAFNGQLVFTAASTEQNVGFELWITDESLDQVSLIKDIYEGEDSGYPNQITAYGNTLLFFASSLNSENERTGQELWRSDGTPAGTFMVKEIMPGVNPGVGIDGYNSSAILNGIYYFAAKGPGEEIGESYIGGLELWRSDGTEEGTYIVKDLTPTYEIPYGPGWSRPHNLTYFKNKLIFSAYGDGVGNELYQTDGTEAGTTVLKDIFPNDGSGTPCGNSSISSYPSDFLVTPNLIYFFACDGTHGREMWVTNGTEEGTKMIIDMTPGPDGTSITHQTAFHDMMFFVYDDGDENHGNELWRTDGTAEGTVLVKDIATGVDVFERANNSDPADLTVVHRIVDLLYFSAWTPEHNRELWVTDSSTEHTRLVEEMYAGDFFGGNPHNLFYFDSTLFFSATSNNFAPGYSNTGYELWKLNYVQTSVESQNENIGYKLNQNYPNPFNPSTTITYSISEQGNVSLKIFDVLGKDVMVLLNEEKPRGNYRVEFDASTLPGGIYFYRLQSGKYVETKQLVLSK